MLLSWKNCQKKKKKNGASHKKKKFNNSMPSDNFSYIKNKYKEIIEWRSFLYH